MSFFEDFKRTAQDVASKTAKKTEELTSIAKLNVSIKTSEAKFNGICTEIGKMFYEAQRNNMDFTSEIAASIMKLDKISSDIESYKKEIAKLRKVSLCQECGEEIPENALFCQFCGAKQIKPECECCDDDGVECACGCCDCCDECDENEEAGEIGETAETEDGTDGDKIDG